MSKCRVIDANPMSNNAAENLFTYEDYCLLPENGNRYEIIGGELYNAPAPYTSHQRVLRRFGDILSPYCARNHHGELFYAPTDVVLSGIDIVQPDILWISNERLAIITEKNIQGPPDLAIEIISPATRDKDQKLKLKLYQKFRIKEYWLMDLDKRVLSVFVLTGRILKLKQKYSDIEKFESPCFPGLSINLKKIFL